MKQEDTIVSSSTDQALLLELQHTKQQLIELERELAAAQQELANLQAHNYSPNVEFKNLAENIADIVVRVNRDLVQVYVNSAIEHYGVWPAQYYVGKTVVGFSLEQEASWRNAIKQVFATGVEQFLTVEFPDLNKRFRFFEVKMLPEFAPDGSVATVLCIYHDTGEIKLATQQLERQEREIRTVSDNLPDMVARVDRQHRYLYVNKAAAALTGRVPEEAIGKTSEDLGMRGPIIEFWGVTTEKVFNTGQEAIIDYEFLVQNEVRYYQSRLVPERNENGDIETVLCITRDITSLKQAEMELEQRERRYRTLAENSPDVIMRFSRDKKYLYINPTIKNLTGRSPGSFVGKTNLELGYPIKDYQLWEETVDRAIATQQTQLIEFEFEENNTKFYYQSRYVPEFAADGSVESVLVLAHDISKLKETEKALAAEKEHLSITLNSIADGVVATDSAGRIVWINPIAQRLSGWIEAEALGRALDEVIRFQRGKEIITLNSITQKILQHGEVTFSKEESHDTEMLARDGSVRLVEGVAAPIRTEINNSMQGVVLVFNDVTNERKLEEELQKADKLDAVGILAGGIAHDFNNFLTAVQGNIALVKRSLKGNEAAVKHLTDAETACVHAKSLTQQLLTFSRGGTPVKKITALGELLSNSADFALRGSNVRCVYDIAPDLWPVEIDAGQISRVVNNLIINAQQAMPGGGIILVSARNLQIEQDASKQQLPLLPMQTGNYVEVKIQDQGIGIPNEYLSRIFDPYFTTKQQGNGLGLAVSYSIIRNHEGYIKVESELGVGSTFSIYLPSSKKEMAAGAETVEAKLAKKLKVLVMDDQALILELIHDLLKEEGHDAVTVKDGVEAIAAYLKARERDEPFDVVIMDLTIPGGMGGKETIQRLLEIDPNTKAIVSSGYSNDPITSNYKNYGFSAVVAKPFDLDELLQVIQTVAKK